MAAQDTEQPKLQVLPKQVSPVKDAVRSLEAQLASEGSSTPVQEGVSTSAVIPIGQSITSTVSSAESSVGNIPVTEHQEISVHQDQEMAGQILQVIQVAEEQQQLQEQQQIPEQQQFSEQQQLPGQQQFSEQQQLPGQQQQFSEQQQQQFSEQQQLSEQQQQQFSEQQQLPEQHQFQEQHQFIIQQQLPTGTEQVPEGSVQVSVESGQGAPQIEANGENTQPEGAEPVGAKPVFKCVAVSSDGAPDWTKVMSLNKDILKEVLEKHGISMDTTDWPTQKGEDPEARKRRKKAKKAKKKKLKEKAKSSKGNDGRTWCDVCCRQFDNPGSLKHHQRMHEEDSEGPRKCSICSLVFQRRIGLRAHMRKSHPDEYCKDEENKDVGDFNCEEEGCDRTFTTRMGLSQHVNQHHKGLGKKKTYIKRDPGDLKCDQCDKTFTLPHKLTQHMIMHSDERPFKCTQCDGTFKHHSSLRTHELIHSNKDACSCPVCGTMFKRAQYVRRHMIRVHDLLGVNYIPPAPVKRYPCEMCHRAYERRSELSDHMNSHTGAKPHLCEICAKGFAHKRALDVHRKTHTGKGAFHCDVCGKVFGSKSRMREHRVIHTGEKPFICQQCGTRFAHRANLREHLKSVHKTGVEPLPRGRRKGQRKGVSVMMENKEQEPQQTLQYEVLTTRPHPQIEEAQAQAQAQANAQVIPMTIHQQPQVVEQQQHVVQEQPQIMYQEIQLQPVVVPAGNSNMRSMQVQQVHGGQIETRHDDLASVAQIVLQLHTEGTYTVQ